MKAFRILLVLAVTALAFGFVSGASAGVFSYTSGIRVLNLTSTSTQVTLSFYDLAGALNTTATETIGGNGFYSFFPLTAVSSGFNGSVVVSSQYAIAATSNLLGYSGATQVAAGSYTAASSGSTSVYLPTLMHANSGYNTWFYVQNAGSSAANVSVAYTDGTSNTGTVNPGASIQFDQATEAGHSAVFAATVTSTNSQPLVVAVVEESPAGVIFAYNGFSTTGASTILMPLINENNPSVGNWRTGMQIQNTGSVDTTVTLTYTPRLVGGAGTACTETHLIEHGKGTQFAFNAFAGPVGATPISGSTCVRGVKFIGNAKVTSNTASQNLVAVINQLNSTGQNKGGAYDSIDPSTATNTVVLPLIMDRNSGWYTGFNVQNVSTTSSTHVLCTFSGNMATTYKVEGDVPAGGTIGETQDGKIGAGFIGSAVCTATGGTENKIVGIVNQLNAGSTTDLFMVYNAINTTTP
jgi:hypothetical protein